MNWDTSSRNRMEKELREFCLREIPGLKHLRILLHGPAGAGKSSFINSIDSVFRGQICIQALVSAGARFSFTKKYKTHKFRNGNSGNLPFVVNDTMGLQKGNLGGAHPSDIISALKGHVKNNYRFNPVSPLSVGDPDYNPNPTLSDRVHCLVSVVSMDAISRMEDDVINKMQAIREAASDLGIPQVVFVTHVDQTCPLVYKDLQHIYSSKKIKNMMQKCSNRLGVPMNCIYPVTNYHEDVTLDSNLDSLILDALRNAVNFAREYVDSLELGASMPASTTSQMPPAVNSAQDIEFDLEWRKINWDTSSRNRMEKELREFRLREIPDLKHLRILLHGPVGAGKSSFINSIDSVFQGQVSARALGDTTGACFSFTKKYKTYIFRNGNSENLPFVVNDIMGLQKGNLGGAHPSDIISALKGHVKSNYKFNPVSPLSVGDPDYNPNPTLSDRVHCLVSVVSMDAISCMEDDVINKMQAIREAASDLDIPQAVVMTTVDKDTLVAEKGLRMIYFSKKIKQKMQVCSDKLHVPMNCIFPVKNYHEETDVDLEMDCLILTALRRIVHFAHEYVDSVHN